MHDTATPERTQAQRREALEKANHHRIVRAEWKKRCKRGEVDARELLADPPAEFESMKVVAVLMAMPKISSVKASVLLRSAQIAPSKTIAGITERQRATLIGLLPRRRPGQTAGRRGSIR